MSVPSKFSKKSIHSFNTLRTYCRIHARTYARTYVCVFCLLIGVHVNVLSCMSGSDALNSRASVRFPSMPLLYEVIVSGHSFLLFGIRTVFTSSLLEPALILDLTNINIPVILLDCSLRDPAAALYTVIFESWSK